MGTRNYRCGKQAGYMLLEVMVSILIFSVGVLGIMGLLATAIQHDSDAQNRTDACFLVDELVGQMWADHLLEPKAVALQAKYAGGNGGGDGPGYTAWLNRIIGNQKLPGVTASANLPVVTLWITVDGVVLPPGTLPPLGTPPEAISSAVSITLSWQAPGGLLHQYNVVTEIQ